MSQLVQEYMPETRKFLGYHCDLKIGETLNIGPGVLELTLVGINGLDGLVRVDEMRRPLEFPAKTTANFRRGIVVHNHGRRHVKGGNNRGGYQGRRIHLSLTFPDHFEVLKYRKY